MKTWLAALFGLGLALGCKSEPRGVALAGSASASALVSAAPKPSASLAAVAPPAPKKVALGLETEVVGAGPELRLFVSAPALGLREPIGTLSFPFACVALAAEGERPWRVTCSPRYRKALAEARVVAGELVLQVFDAKLPTREIKKPLAPSYTLELPDAEASSRIESCAGVTPTRELQVTFPTANWTGGYTPNTITYLALVGLAEPLPLIQKTGWWQGCRARDVNGAVEFHCPEARHHFARITSEGSAVRYEWQDSERHVGRVLLPCTAKAKLVVPETFSMGYRYN